MRQKTMNCEQARRAIAGFGIEDLAPEVRSHLLTCDACLDVLLDAKLTQPPVREAPAGFAARVISSVPTRPEPMPAIPHYGVLTAACLLAVFLVGLMSFQIYTGQLYTWSDTTTILTAAAALEMCAVILWVGRISRV